MLIQMKKGWKRCSTSLFRNEQYNEIYFAANKLQPELEMSHF